MKQKRSNLPEASSFPPILLVVVEGTFKEMHCSKELCRNHDTVAVFSKTG